MSESAAHGLLQVRICGDGGPFGGELTDKRQRFTKPLWERSCSVLRLMRISPGPTQCYSAINKSSSRFRKRRPKGLTCQLSP